VRLYSLCILKRRRQSPPITGENSPTDSRWRLNQRFTVTLYSVHWFDQLSWWVIYDRTIRNYEHSKILELILKPGDICNKVNVRRTKRSSPITAADTCVRPALKSVSMNPHELKVIASAEIVTGIFRGDQPALIWPSESCHPFWNPRVHHSWKLSSTISTVPDEVANESTLVGNWAWNME